MSEPQAEAEQAPSLLQFSGDFSSRGQRPAEVAGAEEAAGANFTAGRNSYLDQGRRGECRRARLPAGMQHVSDLLDQPAAVASS